jgi:ParB-like chromosome segregation protein Spo0J
MAAALVENLQREDLNPIDEGEGYRRLIEEFALTQERVAESVGKSRSHVANTMRLLKLPPTVQTELRRGAISAGHARALLTHPDPARAALAVISQGLSVRQTRSAVQVAFFSLPIKAQISWRDYSPFFYGLECHHAAYGVRHAPVPNPPQASPTENTLDLHS